MTNLISFFLTVLSPAIGVVFYYGGNIDQFALFSFFVFGPILLLIPRWLINERQLQEKFKSAALDLMKAFAIAIFVINSFGAAYAFKKIPNYDSAAHILNSIISYFVLLILMFRAGDKYKDKALMIIFSFLVIVVSGILWEGYQKTNDILFGTHMFFDPRQPINIDVATDIFSNTVGAFIAAIIVNIYWNKIKEKFLR